MRLLFANHNASRLERTSSARFLRSHFVIHCAPVCGDFTVYIRNARDFIGDQIVLRLKLDFDFVLCVELKYISDHA